MTYYRGFLETCDRRISVFVGFRFSILSQVDEFCITSHFLVFTFGPEFEEQYRIPKSKGHVSRNWKRFQKWGQDTFPEPYTGTHCHSQCVMTVSSNKTEDSKVTRSWDRGMPVRDTTVVWGDRTTRHWRLLHHMHNLIHITQINTTVRVPWDSHLHISEIHLQMYHHIRDTRHLLLHIMVFCPVVLLE